MISPINKQFIGIFIYSFNFAVRIVPLRVSMRVIS